MITNLKSYQKALCVIPTSFAMPGVPTEVKTGQDSRGMNTSIDIQTMNLTLPSADADAQEESDTQKILLWIRRQKIAKRNEEE